MYPQQQNAPLEWQTHRSPPRTAALRRRDLLTLLRPAPDLNRLHTTRNRRRPLESAALGGPAPPTPTPAPAEPISYLFFNGQSKPNPMLWQTNRSGAPGHTGAALGIGRKRWRPGLARHDPRALASHQHPPINTDSPSPGEPQPALSISGFPYCPPAVYFCGARSFYNWLFLPTPPPLCVGAGQPTAVGTAAFRCVRNETMALLPESRERQS